MKFNELNSQSAFLSFLSLIQKLKDATCSEHSI